MVARDPDRKTARRRFLRRSVEAAAGLGALAALRAGLGAVSAPPSERLVLATIGLGGRGQRLTRDFAARADSRVAALCDVDPRRLEGIARDLASRSEHPPRKLTDYRRVLDDPAIDAVVVATPDHWHAPLTIYACQAGKHVYVEKPASHTVWEGRKMVEAARRYNRVVQVGTQNRSAPYNVEALDFIRRGGLGRIHLVKVYNLKPGGPYREPPPSDPPPGVDYDTWLGPAPARPFSEGHFHRGWYFHWAYCGGDMGNDGIHQLDIARWFIGKDYPRAVHASGGNLAFDDDREVPDTQVVTFEFDDLIFTFELTQWAPYMLKTNWQLRSGDSFPYWPQNATRIEFYGTKNLMIHGRHGGGWQVFTNDGKVVAQRPGKFPDAPHKDDFVAAIRDGRRPSADIEEGHRSAILAHLGNISYRLGGRKLHFDGKTERFTNDEEANSLLTKEYRKPFVIPDVV